jgi:GxxExxY protein
MTLKEILFSLKENQAILHYNVSSLEQIKAGILAVKETKIPLIIGVSEGERDYLNPKLVKKIIDFYKEEENLQDLIFLNADHSKSLESAKRAIDLNYDSVLIDLSELDLEENIRQTRELINYRASKTIYPNDNRMSYPNDNRIKDNEKLVLKNLSYNIMRILFEIHNKLGTTFKEEQYKDAIADYLNRSSLRFEREKEINTSLEGIPIKGLRVDFVIENKIILEVKNKPIITKEDLRQCLRYLKSLNLPLAILVNFKKKKLEYRRVINPQTADYFKNENLFGYDSGSIFGRNSGNQIILIEGEVGKIEGKSEIQKEVEVKKENLTKVESALRFVKETKVDLLAISIGNVHGIVEKEPELDFERGREIAKAIKIPLVLHGASGLSIEKIKKCISIGFKIIHINTEFRKIWKEKLKEELEKETVVPYKIYDPVIEEIKKKIIYYQEEFFSK